MYQYHDEHMIQQLTPQQIFVFGSNLAGIYDGGATMTALKYFGAVQGVGRGWMGQCFAIPVQDKQLHNLPLAQIAQYIEDFKIYTANHRQMTYFITAIGCGHAAFSPSEIAPLFTGISDNVILPQRFQPYLNH